MKTSIAMASIILLTFTQGALADVGDRIEARLDNRGDRINHQLDRASNRAAAAGHPKAAVRLDRKGNRIDRHLDIKGNRINNRLNRRNRINRAL